MKQKIVKWIPNILTLLNMAFGFSAVLILLKTNRFATVPVAVAFIIGSVVIDSLDGVSARKLNACSELGKQLDSFADIISFGIAPAFLVNCISSRTEYWAVVITAVASGLFLLGGAFRLARYNIADFSNHFVGVPITAAGLITALNCGIWYLAYGGKTGSVAYIAVTVPLCLLLTFAMVSRFRVQRLFGRVKPDETEGNDKVNE